VSGLRLPEFGMRWGERQRRRRRTAQRTATTAFLRDQRCAVDHDRRPDRRGGLNNEFGRPNLVGYFRSFEANVAGRRYGYHKPIMIAGGIGSIRDDLTHKLDLPPGTC